MVEVEDGVLNIYLPDDCDFVTLSEMYPNAKTIIISKKKFHKKKDMEGKIIGINFDKTIAEVSLKGIENFKGVKEIEFKGENVKPTDLKFLNGCENLEKLSVQASMDLKEMSDLNVPKLTLRKGDVLVDINRMPGSEDKKNIFIHAKPSKENMLAKLQSLNLKLTDLGIANLAELQYDFSLKEIKNIKGVVDVEIKGNVKAKDFEVLYEMKDLERLTMLQQRDLKEFDVSKVPKLQYLDLRGCGVEKIKGMGEKEPSFDCAYNFATCPFIKEMEGLDIFMSKMVEDESILGPILMMDDAVYQRFITKEVDGKRIYEELEQKLIEEPQKKSGFSSIVINTELCDNPLAYKYNGRGTPLQMKVQREYLDYVLKEECHIKETDSEWVKAKKAYDWVTDNFSYADGLLNAVDSEYGGSSSGSLKQKFFGENGYDPYYIRSAYFSLLARQDISLSRDAIRQHGEKGKYAICAGIANVYVQMLEQMGITAHVVQCYYGEQAPPYTIIMSHAMVASKIDGKYYYFDPTWDLKEKKYKFFGLTREQATASHYVGEYSDKSMHLWCIMNSAERFDGAQDIQEKLKKEGLLVRKQVHEAGEKSNTGTPKTILTALDILNFSAVDPELKKWIQEKKIRERIKKLKQIKEKDRSVSKPVDKENKEENKEESEDVENENNQRKVLKNDENAPKATF